MAGVRGNAGSSSRPSSAAATPPKSTAAVQRERFTVELKLNETTFVSWKKLLSESCKDGSNQAEKLTTKHNGCLVDKGKVEGIEHNHTPKRWRRKDSTNIQTQKDSEQTPSGLVNMGSMRIETDASSVPSAGKKSPCKIKTNYAEHYQGDKHLKSKLNASTKIYKKMSTDFATQPEKASSVKISTKNPLRVQPESKKLDMHKTGAFSSGDLVHKSRGKTESFDVMPLASRDKGISSQVMSQPKKLTHSKNDMEVSARLQHRERDGVRKLPVFNSSGNIYPKKRAACHQEQTMRKRPTSSTRVAETTKGVHIRYGQERTTSVSAGQVLVSPVRPRASSADKTPISVSGSRPSLKHYDKVGVSKPVKDGGGTVSLKRKLGVDIDKFCGLEQHSLKQQVKGMSKPVKDGGGIVSLKRKLGVDIDKFQHSLKQQVKGRKLGVDIDKFQHSLKQQVKGRPRADKSNLSPGDLSRLQHPNLRGSTLKI